MVYLYLGGAHPDTLPAFTFYRLSGEKLGTAVSGGGDLDGDGLSDLIAGTPTDPRRTPSEPPPAPFALSAYPNPAATRLYLSISPISWALRGRPLPGGRKPRSSHILGRSRGRGEPHRMEAVLGSRGGQRGVLRRSPVGQGESRSEDPDPTLRLADRIPTRLLLSRARASLRCGPRTYRENRGLGIRRCENSFT